VAEGFIGDAVLGVFGVPAVHDDDAVRAIRAAVAIRDSAGRLGRSLSLPFPMRVRVGVNTGHVAVGTATDRNIVIGVEVNIGARLQQAAEPGEILVGETSVQLARTMVDFGAASDVRAKVRAGADRPAVECGPARSRDRARPQVTAGAGRVLSGHADAGVGSRQRACDAAEGP
jgi:class 3 adenylate cyclase